MSKPKSPPATPATTPDPTGSPPESPRAVAKATAGKGPREIMLERKLSTLEDRVDGLTGWQGEVNRLMADLGLGAAKKPAAQGPAAPSATKGFFDDLAESLGLDS